MPTKNAVGNTLKEPKPATGAIIIGCNVCDATHTVLFSELETANKLKLGKNVEKEMISMMLKHIQGHKERKEI